jgi:tubulin polyglutamylase TTLL6/13
MYVLARKNNLGKHLNKMRKRFEKDYSFFPKTWMLPSEMSEFKSFYNGLQDKNQKTVFIVKPEASC